MTSSNDDEPQFFLTAPAPCPYLAECWERKVFTYLAGQSANGKNSVLTQLGFRRSQNVAYRPVCDGCNACISVRIVVDGFTPDRTMKRIIKKNSCLSRKVCPPKVTNEQYALFRRYLDVRHSGGGMSDMTFEDYKTMVEGTVVDTSLIEYRRTPLDNRSFEDNKSQLIAAALTDRVDDGLSMVYSFYSPDESHASLGVFMILDHIQQARQLRLPYVYLGYWVKGSRKMNYKSRYCPQEHLTSRGWKLTKEQE
ncbi:arginyltransferase [uncultured Bartonella sp.]|uniref:arginyltransferase n=1 Tax=uncultured Bartonella sp. TaxID=104108 RepID=UPI0025E6C632|nr:arginyltransferase [uncultured Bartonella sp.]